MPRNRTVYQAKREHELTAGEILDVCGPSWKATKRAACVIPSRRERKRSRRELTTWEKIGRRVRRIRCEARHSEGAEF